MLGKGTQRRVVVLERVLPQLREQNHSWVPPEVTVWPQLWHCWLLVLGAALHSAQQQRFWVAEKSGILLGRGSYWGHRSWPSRNLIFTSVCLGWGSTGSVSGPATAWPWPKQAHVAATAAQGNSPTLSEG